MAEVGAQNATPLTRTLVGKSPILYSPANAGEIPRWRYRFSAHYSLIGYKRMKFYGQAYEPWGSKMISVTTRYFKGVLWER